MDFELNEEQRLLVDTLRDLGKREDFRSLAAEIDRTAKFPGICRRSTPNSACWG